MSQSDPIADMLTIIRNAGAAGHAVTSVRTSLLKESVLRVLRDEGFIAGYESSSEGAKRTTKVSLKYHGKQPVVTGLKRMSTPGRRVYVACNEIPRVRGGIGTAIVSTPQGVLSGREARHQNVGGELICLVW
jgi:small subunit ribosomal protein S8